MMLQSGRKLPNYSNVMNRLDKNEYSFLSGDEINHNTSTINRHRRGMLTFPVFQRNKRSISLGLVHDPNLRAGRSETQNIYFTEVKLNPTQLNSNSNTLDIRDTTYQ